MMLCTGPLSFFNFIEKEVKILFEHQYDAKQRSNYVYRMMQMNKQNFMLKQKF